MRFDEYVAHRMHTDEMQLSKWIEGLQSSSKMNQLCYAKKAPEGAFN